MSEEISETTALQSSVREIQERPVYGNPGALTEGVTIPELEGEEWFVVLSEDERDALLDVVRASAALCEVTKGRTAPWRSLQGALDALTQATASVAAKEGTDG